MNELDAVSPDVLRQRPLPPQRPIAKQAADAVFGNRKVHRFDVSQEVALSSKTSDTDIESRPVQFLCQIQKLLFGSTNRKERNELQHLYAH